MLVEAAAGTGKTSLMAARVAMMIASGIDPSRIAAITFTEPAASELEARIRWTVEELRHGRLPPALAGILSLPLGPAERTHLDEAAPRVGEITATTIHGFCQGIIRAHRIDAGLDPGSRVVDETVADALFDEVLANWLKEVLTGNDEQDGPISVLAKDDPLGVVKRVREIAILRRDYRSATVPAPDFSTRPDRTFADAVTAFSRWHAAGPGETWTAGLIADLERLSAFFAGDHASAGFSALWRLTQPPRISMMRQRSIDLLPYDRMRAWKQSLGEADGRRRADEAVEHFETVREAYRAMIGCIAQSLAHKLAAHLNGVIEAYDLRKRQAAVLDFDDLLRQARALVCENPDIRAWLGSRYPYLLVDEFQDTDPVQAEIVFCIAAQSQPSTWSSAVLRPGALFLVGDPKQAIYRFRGADVESYALAKSTIAESQNGCLLAIIANFRSRPEVIAHVNHVFQDVLAKAGQPGFVPLAPTLTLPPLPFSAAAKLTIDVPRDASAEDQREAEAAAVAKLCARLIGALKIHGPDGTERYLRAGDIALLAPTHTDLWRYERALEAQRIAVASQAGHALFRRQELQDILVLVRALADPLDTLAFGALMRGPVVGLTDEDLLDITAALSPDQDGRRRFQLRTSADEVINPLAKDVLLKLQALHRLAAELTPMQLVAFAIERLNLRVIMAARHSQRNARARANLDAIVELARPYNVAGLRAFALDLQRGWQSKRRHPEGRGDASEDSVEIVTMHSAKGLEWPVVITVNSSTQFKPQDQFVYRQSDNTIHWIVGGIEPPALVAAREEEEFREARQRERLWYVATTRARDLLVIPDLPGAPSRSWSRVMDLGQKRLSEIRADVLPEPIVTAPQPFANDQTVAVFAAEGERLAAASPPIAWDRPSDRDADRSADLVDAFVVDAGAVVTARIVGAGALRGTILHKLMEELLTGELEHFREEAIHRATELLAQLQSDDPTDAAKPDAVEMAETALRTLALPELAPFLAKLVPEVPLWAANPPCFLAGRADAAAIEGERIALVVDWKSDVNPAATTHSAHVAQLRDYLRVTGAERGAIVYMSAAQVSWVERP
ncbi:UvrD-helicase domain-containing protein [Bradyrhizobium barranii subsp. apii]|uniref:DNA 3'-5' helicase n=1 Tax=Bradyrhizobium barranii subsp. apii TaxID=2819348 RepID=A0A8U0FSX4_9BRAD|nr:UvrD-helicase domain-containing protein [Bradyrhizobium barranii]UPT89808.1 UvrD-helicase domain-containing protein [Bradyrhizobium barranii subsp. apii]